MKIEESLGHRQEFIYGKRCKQLAAQYPWFDANPVSESAIAESVAVASTPEAMASGVTRIEAELRTLKAKFDAFNTSLKLPLWVAVALLAYLALRR